MKLTFRTITHSILVYLFFSLLMSAAAQTAGQACDLNKSATIPWAADPTDPTKKYLFTVDTPAPRFVGQSLDISGTLQSAPSGLLRVEARDSATHSIIKAFSEKTVPDNAATPNTFHISLTIPTSGTVTLFACLDGAKINPPFEPSFSVADAPGGGGGGCALLGPTQLDPILPALLGLAIGYFWRRRHGAGVKFLTR
jgi:hypothetical protein